MALVLELLAVVTLGATGSGNSSYPLAAAFVVDEKVVVADLPSRAVQPLELEGLIPYDADLSPDKKLIVFNAVRKGEERASLFFYHLAEKRLEQVETSTPGSVRFPRFADNGALVYFTAAHEEGPGGPDNPSRLFRLRMKDRELDEVSTQKGRCEFSPVGLSRGRAVHISTHCFLGFELALTDTRKNTTTPIGSVSSASSELAASFDGNTLLYTSSNQAGIGFYVWSKQNKTPRLLASIAAPGRMQPKFVCPKDALFYSEGTVWVLDSHSGRVEPVIRYPAAASDGGAR